jgi:hypothetical protein
MRIVLPRSRPVGRPAKSWAVVGEGLSVQLLPGRAASAAAVTASDRSDRSALNVLQVALDGRRGSCRRR